MSGGKFHEKNVLPEGEWVVARGKKNTDELFVQARKTGGRLCRMWNGATGRDAVARLFAGSKALADAASEAISYYHAEDHEQFAQAMAKLEAAWRKAMGIE